MRAAEPKNTHLRKSPRPTPPSLSAPPAHSHPVCSLCVHRTGSAHTRPWTASRGASPSRVASGGAPRQDATATATSPALPVLPGKSRFARPVLAVCLLHWVFLTSGRALHSQECARPAWRAVVWRGRPPRAATKRVDFARHAQTAGESPGSEKRTFTARQWLFWHPQHPT